MKLLSIRRGKKPKRMTEHLLQLKRIEIDNYKKSYSCIDKEPEAKRQRYEAYLSVLEEELALMQATLQNQLQA